MASMWRGWLALIAAPAGLMAAALAGCASPAVSAPANPTPKGLQAFASDQDLAAYLKKLTIRRQRETDAMPMPGPMSPPPMAAPSAADNIVVTGAAPNASITNNQVTGVDEGDIVKASGDFLVILRRGKLFTVSLAGGTRRAVASIDAFPPGVDASGDWYDEMLMSGDRVIVVGYSYKRGGTQVNRFRLSPDGRLRFEDSYALRSNDYYSSRNYASRLIGSKLVFYTPLDLGRGGDPLDALPAVRRWRPGEQGGAWTRVVSGTGVYIPRVLRQSRDATIETLHSVTSCDLTAPVLDCEATAVLGAEARTFFVSGNAVYLWIGEAWQGRRKDGMGDAFLYRLPLNGGRPSAVAVRGMPIDQFSFQADATRGTLHIVVRAEGGGDRMWRPEVTDGAVALLDVPMSAFGDGSGEVALDRYRPLPALKGDAWNFHNRFVGDWLLYGGGAFGDARAGEVVAVPLAGGAPVTLALGHQADRIEPIGGDAMVVGEGKDGLGFTAIDLDREARLGATFLLPEAREGESRSHGFFYRADSADGRSGLMGLPVARLASDPAERLLGSAAAMLFLKRDAGQLTGAGELASGRAGADRDDGCVASCVDWYGNARPIFWRGRIFALLGYELVEGRMTRGRIAEVGRIGYSPLRR